MLPHPGNGRTAGQIWSVVDLFSGAGGASYGFHVNGAFRIAGAADAEIGKPSTGHGAIDCNATYLANIGVAPVAADLAIIEPAELGRTMAVAPGIDVLIACPPCTGFSRVVANNHVRDDPRNSLVARVADYAEYFAPRVIFMENARELLRGRFSHHFERLRESLESMGYRVRAEVHMLTRFGLPQQRERSLVLAVRDDIDQTGIRSNTFAIELPKGSGKMREFPEVDRADWFSLEEARRKILKGQVALLDQFERKIPDGR